MWIVKHLVSTVLRNAGHHGLFHRCLGSLPKLEHRYLHCTCCWRSRISIPDFDLLTSTISSEVCEDEGKSLDLNYSPEERTAILERLNTATVNDLAQVKLLRGRKCVNIVEYRTQNGPFKDLESITKVPLFKHKTALVVFHSILHPNEKRESRKPSIQGLMKSLKPAVDRKFLEEARSIVSIVSGMDKIAWAHMDRGLHVLDWKQQKCPNFAKEPFMASAYFDDISSVVSRIPEADIYLMEKSAVTLQNMSMYHVLVHLRTVEAMLFVLLGQRNKPGAAPNVLNMVRLAVGRHFGLMVGDARTSGDHLVRQMMTDSVWQKNPRVSFPPPLVVRYRSTLELQARKNGDELCDALLQAIAFYEKLSELKAE
ncbi:hypothetical protein COCON_G00025420 [Conger conger]|uniref:Transcription elongation factor, mitochondrial n=1 Tax=Conger conger TaxID=82655 RepID=A0A9Q1I4V0_CONCO|nr:transcription elongation factor, mitochondrial [Conger conger]KAJ8283692.1 hypothetical protein COCON_G00025420 [Conger conger]